MERLEAQRVVAGYSGDAAPVLAGLTLELRPGELVGIIGPNGSGKSTLVRLLSRALAPEHGEALLSGRDLYREVSARASAQRIAVVPQDTSVAFGFTVREVVEMGRAPYLPRRPFAAPDAADEAAVTDALRRAGVEALAERVVTTLSGGERQRVLLARALAQQGDVLLLDEPTAHLDLQHQSEALALARFLAHTQSKAVLVVLHDLNLAAAACDRVVLMQAGRIVAQGEPAEVLTPARVHAVYGVRVWLRRHPVTGRPYLLPLPAGQVSVPPTGPAILVLCGGGTGAALLDGLARRGCRVTAGGLSAGDTDAEAAQTLAIPFPQEAPFSPLSDAVLAETTRMAGEADALLLSSVPFGLANVALLDVALESCRAGKPVVCIQPPGIPFAARDFAGGKAVQLWDALQIAGARVVPDAETAVRLVAPDELSSL